MLDANNKLLDTVTMLTDARAADRAAHAVTVHKWRGGASLNPCSKRLWL